MLIHFHLPSFVRSGLTLALLAGAFLLVSGAASADETKPTTPAPQAAAGDDEAPKSSPSSSTPAAATPAPPAHVALLKGTEAISGLIPMYRKDNTLYGELSSSHYNNEYIVLIAIARGIGAGPLLGGMTWGFGDDWMWAFRKVDGKVHVIRRNVRFRATKGSPEATAVENAYTDSVLFSLPIVATGPKGGDLVDLSGIFMTDLPQISQILPGFIFSPSKSTWHKVKGFPDNVEIEVAATYASGGNMSIDSVADSRGVTVNVHYSISKLPSTGYQSRLADDRVGYFLTVVKDYSTKTEEDRFIRYINRWDLQKADASAKVSPPKKPIVFWIERTVPYQYRAPIRDGIMEWNKAFEKAGIINAIEVRQQPDNADWDPEDVNYNTFRWITSSAGFAMGPSRVNPYTGQILDADIIFDADFLQFWKMEFDTLTPASIAEMTGGPLDLESYQKDLENRLEGRLRHDSCRLNQGMAQQLALATTALIAQVAAKEGDVNVEELKEKLIMQGLKEVTMHEVGHTLGLRHNFKGSTMLSLEDMNNPDKTRDTGMVATVMDYNPTNVVPKGMKQGDYFTTTIGPYDVWAIQYGYTPFSGGTQGEVAELKKIASRSGEPGLSYATDEDTRGIDPDPDSNRFDMGSDAVAYARQRAQLVKELVPGLVDRMTKEGDDYVQARRTFNILLSTHGQAMYFAARYVGGLNVSRSHKGDKDAKPPISVIDVKKQREALDLLEEQVFSDKPFSFPPELYNHLAASRWSHWGAIPTLRPDFPVHDVVAMWQDRILTQLLSPLTLTRIHDSELKVPADQDMVTSAELIERLTKAVFSELESTKAGEFTPRKPAISSLRRNLQRGYLERLSQLALGVRGAPQDCQTVAYYQLSNLADRIDKLLDSKVKLDTYSQAHLEETAARIAKVLDARITLAAP